MRSESASSGKFPLRLLILGTILGAACAAGAADGEKQPDVDSPEVKWAVLAQLREPTKAEMAELERMLRTIAGEDVEKRDKALRQFLADPSPYLMWLERMGRLSFEREEQNRLEELTSSNAEFRKALDRWQYAWVAASAENLTDRPDYLIPLLKQTKGLNRDAVVRRLGKLTRQSFANDLGAWEKWWARQKAWGRFDQFAPQMGDLIPLTLLDGALRLDRDHWAQVAAGIDREELRKQFEELYLKGRGTDKERALKAAKDATTGEDYKLVLSQLQLAAEASRDRRTGSEDSPIRLGYSGGGFHAELFRRDDRFRIILEESFGPRRRLELWDNARGGLLLTLTNGSEGSALILRQREDGRVVVGHVDREQATCFSDRSFLAFCRAHPGYAEQQVFARLRRVGVSDRKLPKIAAAPAPESRPAASVPPEEVGEAQWEKGALQEIPEDVGRLIGLTVGREGLCVDRRHWQRRVERSDPVRIGGAKEELRYYFRPGTDAFKDVSPQRADLLKSAALAMKLLHHGCRDRWGSGGGGGSGMGGRTMNMDFDVFGAIEGRLNISTSSIGISLREDRPPEREIEILDDGQGGLRILVNRSADGAFLMILQGPNGRFAVAEARGQVFFTAAGSSFFEFYRKHRKYVEERLFAYLGHLGVAVPPRLYGHEVKDAVLLKLTGPSEADLLRARQLIVQLDHSDFRKRDEATRLLTAGFGRYSQVLGEARRDESLSAEAKRRLETIFRDRPEVEKIEQIIADVGLLEDVGYLIELLAGTKGADRQAVAARLKKLTGQNLGNDLRAWEEWLSRRRPQ